LKKSRFSDEQIAHALRQADAGTPVAEIVRKMGVSEATFYAWKKNSGRWERLKFANCANCAKRTPSSSVWSLI
jgi:putative transposase